jgi:hypothetical protein
MADMTDKFVKMTGAVSLPSGMKIPMDKLPPSLQKAFGADGETPGVFSTVKAALGACCCMCVCPGYYARHMMGQEDKQAEEDRLFKMKGVKTENVTQVSMEAHVHELLDKGGFQQMLEDGSEAHIEICLYPFDGKVEDWPTLPSKLAKGLPGRDEQKVPIALHTRQLVSVHPSPASEALGWKFGEILTKDGLRLHGFFPREYTISLHGFLTKIKEYRTATAKAQRVLYVGIHHFERPENIPEDLNFKVLQVIPGQVVEVLQEAHGWMQGVSHSKGGERVTGWLPEVTCMKMTLYLDMMVEFEDMVRRMLEKHGGDVEDGPMAPPKNVTM